VRAALAEARLRGWHLVALSNTDRDLIDASLDAIGVPFEGAIVASEVGSYKPAHGHWHAFYESTGADRSRHVHVAQSYFHDIVPASDLGIPSVWINRLGEQADRKPTCELPDLNGLADVLDGLVRA
jgi:2-haloacid dehalogenase